MGYQTLFFATKNDLINSIENINSKLKLKFVLYERANNINKVIFNDLGSYKKFGENSSGNISLGQIFLVVPKENEVNFRITEKLFGLKKEYIAYQFDNLTSCAISLGGEYRKEFLLVGNISTVFSKENKKGVEFYETFKKEFLYEYKKIGKYYVGKNALHNKEKYRFITMGIDEPEEYDFQFKQNN